MRSSRRSARLKTSAAWSRWWRSAPTELWCAAPAPVLLVVLVARRPANPRSARIATCIALLRLIPLRSRMPAENAALAPVVIPLGAGDSRSVAHYAVNLHRQQHAA